MGNVYIKYFLSSSLSSVNDILEIFSETRMETFLRFLALFFRRKRSCKFLSEIIVISDFEDLGL